MSTVTPDVKFCVRYLLEHGINSLQFRQIVKELNDYDLRFELVPVNKATPKSFYDELAEKLRELWPPGDKDGKYAWRDSVPNLSRRLKILWDDRLKGKEFTIDQCLTCARRYLAQFESNTKYMQTLKYFILKQDSVVKNDGRITYTSKSKLADMLEGVADEDAVQNEWDFLVNQTSVGEGDLV